MPLQLQPMWWSATESKALPAPGSHLSMLGTLSVPWSKIRGDARAFFAARHRSAHPGMVIGRRTPTSRQVVQQKRKAHSAPPAFQSVVRRISLRRNLGLSLRPLVGHGGQDARHRPQKPAEASEPHSALHHRFTIRSRRCARPGWSGSSSSL